MKTVVKFLLVSGVFFGFLAILTPLPFYCVSKLFPGEFSFRKVQGSLGAGFIVKDFRVKTYDYALQGESIEVAYNPFDTFVGDDIVLNKVRVEGLFVRQLSNPRKNKREGLQKKSQASRNYSVDIKNLEVHDAQIASFLASAYGLESYSIEGFHAKGLRVGRSSEGDWIEARSMKLNSYALDLKSRRFRMFKKEAWRFVFEDSSLKILSEKLGYGVDLEFQISSLGEEVWLESIERDLRISYRSSDGLRLSLDKFDFRRFSKGASTKAPFKLSGSIWPFAEGRRPEKLSFAIKDCLYSYSERSGYFWRFKESCPFRKTQRPVLAPSNLLNWLAYTKVNKELVWPVGKSRQPSSL